jgi:16S rRNA (adenine1518-N6/adenine1519-N6)-dimethyltransferase
MNADRRALHRAPASPRADVAGHVPRKRFGQHFLADRAVLAAIVSAIDPQPADRMIEIGPGPGALTGPLIERLGHLTAIEIDRDLCARLRRRWPPERLSLIEGDALTVPLGGLLSGAGPASRARLVGNLPYNISSPLLVRLIDDREHISDQHFLLQNEVVDRVVAAPGSTQFGRLSVLLQAFYQVDKVLEVPPEAFEPPPRVDSALLRMRVNALPLAQCQKSLQRVLAAAFGQRRKMLRGTLLPWLREQGVDPGAIDGELRAEDLSVETYCALANSLRSINSIL